MLREGFVAGNKYVSRYFMFVKAWRRLSTQKLFASNGYVNLFLKQIIISVSTTLCIGQSMPALNVFHIRVTFESMRVFFSRLQRLEQFLAKIAMELYRNLCAAGVAA